jgi:hypothetical protein
MTTTTTHAYRRRIATSTCLTALERRRGCPLPSGLARPPQAPEKPLRAAPTTVVLS